MIGKFLLSALGIFLALTAAACVGGKIAYIGSDGNVWTVSSDGTDPAQLTADATGMGYGVNDPYVLYEYPSSGWQRPIWAPDGSKLAYFRASGVAVGASAVQFFVTDLTSPPQEVHTLFIGKDDLQVTATAWSADGAGIYFEECSGETIHKDFTCQVKLVNVSTGDVSVLFTIEKGHAASIVNPSPDGRHLAWHKSYVEGVGNPCIFNLETRQNSCLGEFRGRSSWSPDGTRLLIDDCGYGCGDDALRVFDLRDWSSTPLLQHTEDIGYAEPVWSPTGDKIAYTMCTADLFSDPLPGTPSLWVINSDGSSPVLITNVPGGGRYSFSADGKYLVHTRDPSDPSSSSPEIWISAVDGSASWRIADGREPIWQPR